MYSYTAYGLNIQSEIGLPIPPGVSSPSDVQIRRGPVNFPVETTGPASWTTENDVYIRFPEIGTVQISLGRAIVVDADGVDDRTLALVVLGPPMGVLLHQRGLLVLHASAVVVGGGVVAFLGHSGWGKSTMAAAMVKMGNVAFCDDMVAVAMEAGRPVTLPGYPFLKLGLDSGAALGYGEIEHSLDLLGDDRRRIGTPGPDPWRSLVLTHVYVLAEGEAAEVERLKPQAAARDLIRHSFALPCLNASGMSAVHLKYCAELVDRVPISKLSRPRRLDLIQEVAELVLKRDRRHGG